MATAISPFGFTLGQACAEAGPLDAKTRELVKLGTAVGGRLEGAVHAHARRGAPPRKCCLSEAVAPHPRATHIPHQP